MNVKLLGFKNIVKSAGIIIVCLLIVMCGFSGGEKTLPPNPAPRGRGSIRVTNELAAAELAGGMSGDGIHGGSISVGAVRQNETALELIAEIERAGIYVPGLALTESGLREQTGDYAGAAIAAYKELSWAYGYGASRREEAEEGLQQTINLFSESFHILNQDRNSAIAALRGCIAFLREDWRTAEELLMQILKEDEEPDSFLRWMLLVCALERGDWEQTRAERSAYGAIRARYAQFPEYWYRGARVFQREGTILNNSADDGNIAAIFAEQCINASPQGPFAEECRRILAGYFGLPSTRGVNSLHILTIAEIENIIRHSVSENSPMILEGLFPLMALPDNPNTLYAMGALKALSSVPEYRSFFAENSLKSGGRLGERLNYISRG